MRKLVSVSMRWTPIEEHNRKQTREEHSSAQTVRITLIRIIHTVTSLSGQTIRRPVPFKPGGSLLCYDYIKKGVLGSCQTGGIFCQERRDGMQL